MSTQAGSVQDILDEFNAHARQELADGKSPQEVENSLMERGLDLGSAVSIVHDCETGCGESVTTRGAGKANVMMGAVVCAIGLLVTVGSFAAASDYGGTYVIAWGAILFGALQVFQGLAQG